MSRTKISLLLDEDVWLGLAATLRQRGYDAVSVHELGRTGLSDEEQMAFAVSQGRAILTHNIGDFVSIAKRYFTGGVKFYGVIAAPHLEKGELLRRVLTLLGSVSIKEMTNTVRFV